MSQSDSDYLYQFSLDQGFKPWRKSANGITILRREWPETRVRAFRAFRDEQRVGSWSMYDGPGGSPSGEIGGNYSLVQGADAPCATLAAWVAQIGAAIPELDALGDVEAAA